MEHHQGGVEIDSEENKGTTITLWLPKKAAGEENGEVAA
jgi:signal transduction histidine kinase